MRNVVHCSGYSLAEKQNGATDRRGEPVLGRYQDWDHVCFGDLNRGLLGRIPMSLRIASLVEADSIIWSTGAIFLGGVSEAEFMLHAALEVCESFISPEILRQISIIEDESMNTFTSIELARQIVLSMYPNETTVVYFVSSANHIPRIARDATLVFSQTPEVIVSACPSHTSYGRKAAADVIIQELG